MSPQPVPMDYASPRSSAPAGRGQFVVPAALAVAVGFLGATAFAQPKTDVIEGRRPRAASH